MIGTWLAGLGKARMQMVAASPSISGIITSIRMASQRCAEAATTASVPFVTALHLVAELFQHAGHDQAVRGVVLRHQHPAGGAARHRRRRGTVRR